MFAVIKSGGRQYKVSVGETLEVNRLPVEDGAQVRFEEVLLISDANGMLRHDFVAGNHRRMKILEVHNVNRRGEWNNRKINTRVFEDMNTIVR